MTHFIESQFESRVASVPLGFPAPPRFREATGTPAPDGHHADTAVKAHGMGAVVTESLENPVGHWGESTGSP